MNTVALVGTLTRDPVVKFEATGTQTVTFTLAITEPSREGRAFTLYVARRVTVLFTYMRSEADCVWEITVQRASMRWRDQPCSEHV